MTMTIDKLNQIEREAMSAPATMLRLRLTEVRAGLASAWAICHLHQDCCALRRLLDRRFP